MCTGEWTEVRGSGFGIPCVSEEVNVVVLMGLVNAVYISDWKCDEALCIILLMTVCC